MSAINGSKSKTNSSKSSTEGGPAPQRFDVAAMVVLCACGTAEAVAGAGERGKCAGLCGGSKCGFCASACASEIAGAVARGGESAALWLVSVRGGGASAAVVPGG